MLSCFQAESRKTKRRRERERERERKKERENKSHFTRVIMFLEEPPAKVHRSIILSVRSFLKALIIQQQSEAIEKKKNEQEG